MNSYEIRTKSGGLIQCGDGVSARYGTRFFLHIDQTANIQNGEDEASILIDVEECKSMIGMLNEYIRCQEGTDYVILASLVTIIDDKKDNDAPPINSSDIENEIS